MNATQSQFKATPTTDDGSLVYLTLDAISVEDGFNPRKFFEDNKFNELVNAVKAEGVIQPIVVRPLGNDKYSLIAGERRFRASIKAGCEDIPAVIRHVDDKQAAVLALMENATRADLSIMEEADSARIVLTHSDNDKDETARKLGWSRQKLDQRLALLHAHASVKTALTEQKIKLGHAVLLCQLTDAMQETTLEAIIKDNIAVADLKARLSGFTLELSAAPFDTTACGSCPRNSSIQTSLFEDSLAGGKCADHECFGQKTQKALELKQTELKETYHVVFLDTERDPSTYTEVCQSGEQGVGAEQYETGCKGCANFGVMLSSKAGCVGQITPDVCFDLTCHSKKVAANKPTETTDTAPSSSTKKTTSTKDAVTSSKQTTSTKTPKKAVTATTPKRVIEKMDAFFQATAEQAALSDVNASLAIAVYTMLSKVNQNPEMLIDGLKSKWSRTISRTDAITLLHGCTVDELKLMLIKAASRLPNLEKESYPQQDGLVATSKSILRATKTDLSKQFLLDKDFIEAHTKGGIEILLREAENANKERFVTQYEVKNGEGSFKSLLKEKHVDLVNKVIEFGFDFSGFVPTCLKNELSDTKTK